MKAKLIAEIKRRMEYYKNGEKDGRKHKDFFWEAYFMGADAQGCGGRRDKKGLPI